MTGSDEKENFTARQIPEVVQNDEKSLFMNRKWRKNDRKWVKRDEKRQCDVFCELLRPEVVPDPPEVAGSRAEYLLSSHYGNVDHVGCCHSGERDESSAKGRGFLQKSGDELVTQGLARGVGEGGVTFAKWFRERAVATAPVVAATYDVINCLQGKN